MPSSPRPPARRALGTAVAVGIAVAGLLGACSNTSTPAADRPHTGTATASESNGVQTVTITTGNDLRFHPSTIVVHTGQVRIVLRNTATPGSGPPHNLQLDGLPGAGVTVPFAVPGQTTEASFTVSTPGTYRFVCTIHLGQGQTGTMIVKG